MRRLLPILGIGAICFLAISVASAAQATEFVKEINYSLEQPFGGVSTITSFGQYLQLVYSYSAGLIGIIAVVLIMAGGIMWIGAAGNEQIISTAKEIIISALTAVVIIVLSYAILIFINPRLVEVSFSLQKIGFTEDGNIFDYEKCTSGNFTGQDCFGEDGISYKCDAVPCGGVAQYNGEFCRGQVCAAGTGGCYSDPHNPNTAQLCQPNTCGAWVETCKGGEYIKYRINSTQTEEELMAACMCGFYFKKVMPQIGAPLNLFAYTADQKDYYQQFCEEGRSQEDWVTFLTPTYSNAAATTWNCVNPTSSGMQCAYDSSIGTCNAL